MSIDISGHTTLPIYLRKTGVILGHFFEVLTLFCLGKSGRNGFIAFHSARSPAKYQAAQRDKFDESLTTSQ
jgi:hypothetical protein